MPFCWSLWPGAAGSTSDVYMFGLVVNAGSKGRSCFSCLGFRASLWDKLCGRDTSFELQLLSTGANPALAPGVL